jgi:diaminohydroxyphosphoribosylaminopyrimidine deaminase/5-amino-6-(5-phosphoribosylamino)uracil reductase
MREALALAARGLGRTSPNPPVGAVVVSGGRIVGRGWHRRAGAPHAEIVALAEAGKQARGATLYCTLEPCSIQGRTPPCAPAVLEAGVRRVVVGAIDPNPLVRGRGLRQLERAGVEVTRDVERAAARHLIRFFRRRVTTGEPWVRVKLAASADGRIATSSGESRWITGPAARRVVHRWRDEMDAIVVGVDTLLTDDPALTCRRSGGRDPIRVVVDSALRTPPAARVLREGRSPVWLAATRRADPRRARALRAKGAEILCIAQRQGRVDVRALLRELALRGVSSVLVEGGGQLAASFLASGKADELCWFQAPVLIGGDGIPMIGNLGVRSLSEAVPLEACRVTPVGKDYLFEASLTRSWTNAFDG